MTTCSTKILIVCYSFPPFPGIGGRRWAKFAKYFAANGVECHIVSAFNYSKNTSVWNSDTKNPNIIVHPIKFRFQYWMGLYSTSLFYRIISKLLRTGLNITKYSPYFSTSVSKKRLRKSCIAIIQKNNIDTVIASGDPYMQNYITELKKKCNVKIILDYRDTWNDNHMYSRNTLHKLTPRQRNFFELSEKKSLQNCDEVVCVYEPFINLLSARSGKDKKHFHIIPNGFDKDDYTGISPKSFSNEIITLYFGGNIHPGGRSVNFLQFLKAYSTLRNTESTKWERFRIIINGNCPADFENELKEINDPHIELNKGFLPNKQYMEQLSNSSFGILTVEDEYADCLFITKAYDYLYLQKPIIYLGKRGKASDFIEKNGIGYAFNPAEKAETFFEKLLTASTNLKYSEEVRKNIECEYDIQTLSGNYLNLIASGRNTDL